jgi:hypothetical protein
VSQLRLLGRMRGVPGVLAVFGVALVSLLVIGGYGLHWRWTGLSSQVTLWDWLQVLALPVALGAVPVLLRHRQRIGARHRRRLLLCVVAFAGLATAGYLIPLGWTGFSGNTLWDWLELLVLPVAVSSASWWAELRVHDGRAIALLGGGAVLLVVVVCGYLVPWRWTGFTGNTLWDWVKLLLVPVLIPTVLLPAVSGLLDDRLSATGARSSRRVP